MAASEEKDTSDKGRSLQWHPPFYAGLQIELAMDAYNLSFENEYQLGTKPLEIDILIIKKKVDLPVQKEIGRIFLKHNIVEYKSPGDYLSIDDFYKGYSYACLYKALGRRENEIKTSEMTITFISHHYPYKLQKYLKERRGYDFVKSGEGIYQITGNDFAMQVIVTSRISREENLWLWSISNPVRDRETAKRLISEYERNRDNNYYESVMDLIVRANGEIFGKEDERMCKALEEIMEDRIVAREEKVRMETMVLVKAEAVLDLLEDYGEIPERLKERIFGENDPDLLRCWLKAAAKTGSLEEFERTLIG